MIAVSTPRKRGKQRELPWFSGNPHWKNCSSYDHLRDTGPSQWAWEFLRRTKKYQAEVDAGHSASAVEWGLSSLVPYLQAQGPSASTVGREAPRWLPLQAFTIVGQSDGTTVIRAGVNQVAVVFDLYIGLRRDILVRQLGQLAAILEAAAFDNGNPLEHKPNQGGKDIAVDTLLLCLRYADAVASNPEMSGIELAEELGTTPRRLSELWAMAAEFMGEDRGYLKLVEKELPPLRQSKTDTRARWKRSAGNADWGTTQKVDLDNPPPALSPQPQKLPDDNAKW
ncbi:DUF6499 domain-containing protein [Polaromonas sp. YR568]|uniref:transcriptional regulator domain-containing protein n=1 Tax=Polaromonas sp. YR568 TaxID=1855301 RepID=UPI003137A384